MIWGNKANRKGRFLKLLSAVLAAVLFFAACSPGEQASTTASDTCTISIRCDMILKNMDLLDPEKKELIPEDGIVLPETEISVASGDSVFDVLKRACRAGKIHLEFSESALYESAYIEGIANIYEFDCGNLSGWMFRVNGEYKNYGCSAVAVFPGDRVEFEYTCDLGHDLGNEWK